MNEVVAQKTNIVSDVSSNVPAILSLVNSFGVPNSDGGEGRDKKVCQEDMQRKSRGCNVAIHSCKAAHGSKEDWEKVTSLAEMPGSMNGQKVAGGKGWLM